MIDYQQRIIQNAGDQFIDHFGLEAIRNDSGELLEYEDYIDGDLKSKVIIPNNGGPTYVKQKGSLHKYHNYITGQGIQNYNDFTFKQLQFTLDHIEEVYPTGLAGKLETLEYGINILTEIDPKIIIEDHILLFKGKEGNKTTYSNGGISKQWDKTNYYLKIYDKGKHYQIQDNILRVEIKFTTHRGIINAGVESLHSLRQKDVLDGLNNTIMKAIDNLTVIDHTDPQISNREKEIFDIFTSYRKLKNLSKKVSRTEKGRLKKKFQEILSRNKLDTLHTEIRTKVSKKFKELTCYKYHEILEGQLKESDVTNTTIHICGNCNNTDHSKGIQGTLFDVTPFTTKSDPKRSYKKRKKEDVPECDLYHNHKIRNDKSNPIHNRVRAISKSVSKIINIDPSLITNLRLSTSDIETLESVSHIPRWQPLLQKLGIEIKSNLKTV